MVPLARPGVPHLESVYIYHTDRHTLPSPKTKAWKRCLGNMPESHHPLPAQSNPPPRSDRHAPAPPLHPPLSRLLASTSSAAIVTALLLPPLHVDPSRGLLSVAGRLRPVLHRDPRLLRHWIPLPVPGHLLSAPHSLRD